jgi:hypothetical protein
MTPVSYLNFYYNNFYVTSVISSSCLYKLNIMKVVSYVALLLIMFIQVEARAQQYDLHDFLKRFKTFSAAGYPKVKRPMPVVNPGSNATAMPNAINPGHNFMTDLNTGLRILPDPRKIYDPKTGYSFNYDPEAEYTVDLEKGKIYKDKTEVKIEKLKK